MKTARWRIPEIVQDPEKNPLFFKYKDKVKANLDRLKKARDQKLEYSAVKDVSSLFTEEPFFAKFSSFVRKEEDWDLPFAAAISFHKGTGDFVIRYNPFFFLQLNGVQRKMIWAHEFFHLILEHLGIRYVKGLFGMWASDLSINSMKVFVETMKDIVLILPNGLVATCIVAGQGIFEEFPPEKSFEEYLGMLRNDPKFSSMTECDAPAFDDHSFLGELMADENGNLVEKTVLREILAKAKEGLPSEWGNIGQVIKPHVVQLCDVALKPETIFKYFVSTIKASCNNRSWTKINRRKRYIRPGRICEKVCNIAVFVDESGSVGEDLLGKCGEWMNQLAEHINFWVIPHDCHVDPNFVFEWKKDEKITFERKLQGGTSFDAPLEYIRGSGLSIDGAVFMTDLEAPLPASNDIPRLWITSKDCRRSDEFVNEIVLYID